MANLITKFSCRVRVHAVADEEQIVVRSVDIHAGKVQMFVGTAVEMKDDEDVDDRCMKDDVSVGSVASRHAHDNDMDEKHVVVGSVADKGNGNGIGNCGGHVPVRSRIDMSEPEVCRDQDVRSVVEVSVEKHDVRSFDKSNVRGSDPSSSRQRRPPRLPKRKCAKIPQELPSSTIATGPPDPAVCSPNDPILSALAPITPMFVID